MIARARRTHKAGLAATTRRPARVRAATFIDLLVERLIRDKPLQAKNAARSLSIRRDVPDDDREVSAATPGAADCRKVVPAATW